VICRQIRFDSPTQPLWPCAAANPREWLVCESAAGGAKLLRGDECVQQWPQPIDAFDWMASSQSKSRWAGFISYDFARLIEELPSSVRVESPLPLFAFAPVDSTLRATNCCLKPVEHHPVAASNFARHDYERAVQRVIDYIAAGDVYQVNLSQQLNVTTDEPAQDIYARLQINSSAAFGALLDFDQFQIVSNSPELFFEVQPNQNGGRTIVSRPIKGTRPRQAGMYEQLLESEKDAAELAMIVDLQRNDLGKVCKFGSVRVTEPRVIETLPTIYHGVATIEGTLRDDAKLSDILKAVFPCGSITGCPKIRAMQIIDELEHIRRGAYCGAIGYIDPDRSMQFSVAIRTMTLQNGLANIPVGGGIVADSTPAAEYDETIVKAQAMLAALGASL
jgi:anthranilate/para-aminobenzoate synthase component I